VGLSEIVRVADPERLDRGDRRWTAMDDPFDFDDRWQQLVARAWSDPVLKAKLLSDPVGVLKAEGLNVPAGVTVRVMENTDKLVNLVFPVKPAPADLSEEELQGVMAGNCGVSNCDCRGICGCNERC
jgi:hypothetical protein